MTTDTGQADKVTGRQGGFGQRAAARAGRRGGRFGPRGHWHTLAPGGAVGGGGDKTVLAEVVAGLLAVAGVGEIVVLAPAEQIDRVWILLGPLDRVVVQALDPRPAAIDARVRIGRAWNLLAWRGGAGQWTVFDEEYHPAAIARLAHPSMVAVRSMCSWCIRMACSSTSRSHPRWSTIICTRTARPAPTYTPAAPGLSGMVLRADIVQEMGEKNVLSSQLLGYDPKNPIFDTLIRDACMQVDPALSKIPNRFCVDTDRAWAICQELAGRSWSSVAQMCQAAARTIAPGVGDVPRTGEWPREVELELTRAAPHACAPHAPRHFAPFNRKRKSCRAAEHGTLREWLSRMHACDDLLLTFGGLGDPLLFPGGIREVLRRPRVGALSICVQTDLAGGDVDGLLAAIGDKSVDVVSITMLRPFGPDVRDGRGRRSPRHGDGEHAAIGGSHPAERGCALGRAAAVEGAGDDSRDGGVL